MYANEPHSIIRLIIASSRPRVPLPSALSPARRLLPFLLLALFAAAVLFGAPATGPAFADGPPQAENTQNPLDTEEVAGTANWSGTLPDFAWTKGTAVNVTLPSYTGATSYEIRGPEHTNHIKALPAGLTFDASARTITGTPTEHFQGELYVWLAKSHPPQEENFRIRVADDDGNHPPERSFRNNNNTQIIPVNTSLHRSIYCNGGGTNDVLYVPASGYSSFFVDPDGDTLTYTVSSSHPKVISVTTATHSGATVIKGTKRHPGTGTVTLTITGTDPDGLSENVQFTVAGLTGCTEIHSINENSAAGTAVGTIGRGHDGGSSFSLTNGTGDTAATYFDINSTTGQITVKTGTTLDYETTTSYTGEVSYTVNSMTANADVTINVNNVQAPTPDRPTLARNSTNPDTALDVSWTAPTSTSTITDYDVQYRARGTSTWTEWNATDTSTTTSATITGLTAGTEYEVQVRTTDSEGDGPWSGTSISLLVAENTAANGNVGGIFNVTATDFWPMSFTLGGTDGSKFKMHTDTGYKAAQSGQIQVKSGTSLDYESKSSYSATLRIVENNLSRNIQDYTYSLFIFVTDVNEPPGKPTVTMANNTATPTTKLDVSWTAPTMTGKPAISDYDVQYRKTGTTGTNTWNSHSFTGTGTTTTLSGLEAGKKYDVQVRANNPETDNTNTPTTDDSPWSDTANAITQSTAVTRSVAENTAAAGNVGAAVTMTAGSYTMAHTLSGTDASKFEIGATTGQITVKSGTTINYEKADGTDHATAPSYSVTVSIAVTGTGNSNSVPNGTGTYTVPVTINVTDVAEKPPKMGTPTVAANSTTPTTKLDASWTAPTMTGKPAVDDYDVRYKKTGDSTWTEMYDQTDSTALSVTLDSLTSGKTYEVQVRAGNHEGDGPWSDSDSAITDASAVTRSIAENSAAGTNVGAAVTAKSTNTTYTYTHALSGTDASKFEIGSATGQITVKSGTSLDYETTTSYSVIVTVTAAAKTQGANTQSVDPNAPGDYVVPVTINVTDVNETPTFSDDTATRSIAENATVGTNVGAVVTASDVDGDTLTYSLEGTDGSKFDIGSSTGQITVKTGNVPNFEAKTSYSVTVKVSDGSLTDTIAVTINVTDVDEPPAAPTVTASANSATPTSKIDASWTPPPMTGKPAIDGYDVRYKKSDESTWTMHKFSGVVTAARGSDGTTASVSWTEYDGSDFDYYRVIVCAADNFSTTGPTCSSAAFTGSAINSSGTTTQAVTGLTAATGYGVILQIWKDGNTSQKVYVQMAANQNDTTVRGTPTFSATSTNIGGLTAGKSYDVQARARNDEGTGAWSATAKAITQVAADGAVTRNVAENSAANANVGSPVTATSNTNNYTLTHELSGTDAGKFEIGSTTGQITVKSGTSLDYESGATSYSVIVTVKAAAAGANAQSLTLDPNAPGDYVVPVTINVTDVNEPPPKLAAPTATQNTATPKTKLDVSWTALTTTQMAGKPAVDDYDVQYRVKDTTDWTSHSFTGTGLSTTLTGLTEGTEYQVQVRAVNDEGNGPWSNSGEANTQDKNVHAEFPNTSATRSVAENTAAGGSVGAAVTATDTENHTLYYSLNGADKDEFDIGLNTGQITVKTGKVPNYEAKTSYSLIVEVSDRKDKDDNADTKIDDTITVTINVTNVNEPPAAPAISVTNNAANPTKKIDVSWVAPDMTGKPAISNYDVQYKLANANDWTNASFGGTETSTSIGSLTHGKSYDVQVRAVNNEGNGAWSGSQRIITDANAVTRSVPENSVAGTNVGKPVTASNTTYTYTHALSGTDAGKFEISSSTGQITVKSGTTLDYETKTSYSVIVTVKVKEEGASINSLDPNAPGDYIVPVIINVANENVPPAPAAPTVTASGDSSDTTLKVSWTAPDMSGYTTEEAITDYNVQYQKQGASDWTSRAFRGTGTTTTITGAVGGVNYNVQIRAVNREGNGRWSPSGDLGNADPKLPTSPSRSIAENSTKDTNVGAAVAATDPDDSTLEYTLGGTDKDSFSIDSSTGQITWAVEDATPDYEAKTSYSVTVSVSDKKDSEGNADTEIDDTVTVIIKVTDVNEQPGKPGTPTLVTANLTSLKVKWEAPDMTGKPAIETYWIYYWPASLTEDDRSTTNSYTNEVLIDEIHTYGQYPGVPLTPGTSYWVQILAGNDEGYSPKSDKAKLSTKSNFNVQQPTPPDDSNPPGGDPPKTTPPTNTPPGGNTPKTTPPTNTPPGGDPPKTTPPTNTPPGGDPPKTTPPTQVPNPTVPPTVQPTVVPTVQPTLPPTRTPTGATPAPTVQSPGPTGSTQAPAPTPAPTIGPTAAPTPGPTAAAKPAPTAEDISVAVVVTPTPQPTPALLMTVGQLPRVFQPATATPQPTATPTPAPVEPTATPVAAAGPASGGPGLAPPAGAANIGDTGEREGSTVIQIIWPDDILRRVVMLQTMVALAAFLIFVFYLRRRRQQQGRQSFQFIPGLRSFTRRYR